MNLLYHTPRHRLRRCHAATIRNHDSRRVPISFCMPFYNSQVYHSPLIEESIGTYKKRANTSKAFQIAIFVAYEITTKINLTIINDGFTNQMSVE